MEKNELINLYYKYFNDENWQAALKVVLEANSVEPNNPWIVTTIGSYYYELRDYQKALEYSKQAFSMHSKDPLVRWNYAGALDSNEFFDEAIKLWKKIINRGVYKIAFIDCGEGIRWAKSIYNDCFYRIGLTYFKLGKNKKAVEYYNKHLALRQRGIPSIYKKSLVLRDLKRAMNFSRTKASTIN